MAARMDQSSRTVTLVLVSPEGMLLGALPPFPVPTPWWQEAGPVVRCARDRFGVETIVLRLLSAPANTRSGGDVTYLAEVAGRPQGLRPWAGILDEQPLRTSWARPGGPAADLAWARGVLEARGLSMAGAPEQVRTWNLSSLWRLPTTGTAAWLKVVPPFFSHEGRLIDRLKGGAVPTLLGSDGARILMSEVPGRDRYDAAGSDLTTMVSQLVDLQRAWVGRLDEMIDLGLPDWRAPALTEAIARVVDRVAPELTPRVRRRLDGFVERLADRFAAIRACGLPETLVHGDFHPGNHRGNEVTLTLLDWGDSGVGHPLLDQAAFLDVIPAGEVGPVRAYWHDAWHAAAPGSDPDRAAELVAPVAAARQAVIYQHFLDSIEPSERVYHRADPALWLARTASLLEAAPRR